MFPNYRVRLSTVNRQWLTEGRLYRSSTVEIDVYYQLVLNRFKYCCWIVVMASLVYSMMRFSVKETCRLIVKPCTSSPLYCIVMVTTTPSSSHAYLIVHRRWYWSTNSFVPPVAHSTCTILATSSFSTLFFFSSCVPSLQAIVLYTLYNVEKMSWILPKLPYQGSVWMVLYTITHYIWFCISLYTWIRIPSLVVHGFVYHFIHGFVYQHSLCMVLYTIVYMVLDTITRYAWLCIPLYTWFCTPSPVIHGFVYQCINGIVYHHRRYRRFVSMSMFIRHHANMQVQKKHTHHE